MNKTMRWLSLSFVMAAIAVQFSNCSPYAPPAVSYTTQSSVNCTTRDCINTTVDNLSLKVNYGGGTVYSVPIDLAEFNLGGDCNEGGFPFNTVRWELYQNNVMVRHSGMLNADSRCVNGRFMVYVYLGTVAGGDPVDRTGLKNQAGVRVPYDLWIEVYGQTQQNGAPQRNTLKGRMRMSLSAI